MNFMLVCQVTNVSQISLDKQSNVVCNGNLLAMPVQEQILSLSQLDPLQTSAFFGAGFGIFLLSWFVGRSIQPILNLVKRNI